MSFQGKFGEITPQQERVDTRKWRTNRIKYNSARTPAFEPSCGDSYKDEEQAYSPTTPVVVEHSIQKKTD